MTSRDGVPTRCAVSADNLLTIPKSVLVSRIVSLEVDSLNAVFEAIHFAPDMPFRPELR